MGGAEVGKRLYINGKAFTSLSVPYKAIWFDLIHQSHIVFVQVPLLMPNRFGARSIHTAAREGHVSVVNTLIKKGESVDARTGDGLTALHIAVECGKVQQ